MHDTIYNLADLIPLLLKAVTQNIDRHFIIHYLRQVTTSPAPYTPTQQHRIDALALKDQ